ncbi:5-formyltetrahydrofolate cyclo-ligase [Escherichia coli]|uniref:5-formyltetrahydrofolate cyclo-ligase n=1 Tax=Escherichia coli TaxID=562 RepID=UPI003EE29404
MQRNFQGKTVVITGACRGIGAGIAERFARDGANLVMVSNAERVHETAEQLRQCYQADILSLEVDVTDEAQVQALYEQAAARFGSIDVSIQNAGIITIDYFDRMPAADFEKVLAVNTTAVWLCCREAAKYMVKQNHGCLINTSSGQGRQGFIYTPHYAASKMGVIGITQSLAHELAQWNITVNAFCPGIIESELVMNKLKIHEPKLDVSDVLPLSRLDVLITPLVAFDEYGQRLGMGGGFYDRTLQNWQHYKMQPVGYAHDCQLVEKLPVEEWDIPLPAVVTPSKVWEW